MLYKFQNLVQRLNQLGYPEAKEHSFLVIKRDFTQEERAGNIEFKDDGIYLKIDGHDYKGYMYLKYPDITAYGMPSFHITTCKVILQQKQTNRFGQNKFDSRYFWHNSKIVTLEVRSTGEIYENQVLKLCNFCKDKANVYEYSNTEGFYNLLDQQEQDDLNQEVEVDIFGYTLDWPNISKEYRKEKDYTCERCGIQIKENIDKRFIHVHHRSGNKINNKRSNLECLCVLCHANKDERHQHNFDKRRMQVEIHAFVEKYKARLKDLENKFIE